ncbi:hypothetical protein NUSPORA_02514 [Nucleospora cyclopteri]
MAGLNVILGLIKFKKTKVILAYYQSNRYFEFVFCLMNKQILNLIKITYCLFFDSKI